MSLLHDADPTSSETDPPELVPLESHVNEMGPMIDNELEVVDRRLAQLTRLSTELVDALNLYHQLMRDMPATSMYGAAMPGPYQQPQQPYMMPPQQQQPPQMLPNAYGAPSYSSMPPTSVPSAQMMPPTSMAAAPSVISGQPDGVMQQQVAPAPNTSQPQTMDPAQYAASYSSPMAQPPQQQQQPPQQQQMAPPPQAAAAATAAVPQSYQPAAVAPVGMPEQQVRIFFR